MQVKLFAAAVYIMQTGGEGLQMRLVARRNLQAAAVYFEEPLILKPPAQGTLDLGSGQQKGATVLMALSIPEGRRYWVALIGQKELLLLWACLRRKFQPKNTINYRFGPVKRGGKSRPMENNGDKGYCKLNP